MNIAQKDLQTLKRRVDDVAFEPINLQPKRLRFAPEIDLDDGTESSDSCSLSMTEADSESEYLSISESGEELGEPLVLRPSDIPQDALFEYKGSEYHYVHRPTALAHKIHLDGLPDPVAFKDVTRAVPKRGDCFVVGKGIFFIFFISMLTLIFRRKKMHPSYAWKCLLRPRKISYQQCLCCLEKKNGWADGGTRLGMHFGCFAHGRQQVYWLGGPVPFARREQIGQEKNRWWSLILNLLTCLTRNINKIY